MITIANRGPLVAATNYWATAMAARGLFYLTFNAGAARLLVPGNSEVVIRELRKRVQHVVVSFGPWFAAGNAMSVEWLAEDGSEEPFSLQLGPGSFDRFIPLQPGEVVGLTATIWVGRGGQPELVAEQRAFVRVVDCLPCLQALPPDYLIHLSAATRDASEPERGSAPRGNSPLP